MSKRFNHAAHGAVEIVRDFGHYVRISTKDGVVSVRRSELSPIADPIPFPAASLAIELESGSESEDDSPPQIDTVAINKATANQIANTLPHTGKLRAKRIVSSRPAGGYASFADLKEVLPDLFNDDGNTDSIEWREIEPLISYEA